MFEEAVPDFGGPVSGFTAGVLFGFEPDGSPWHFEGDIGWNGISGIGSSEMMDAGPVVCEFDCEPEIADYGGGLFWHIRGLYDLNYHNGSNLHVLVGGGIAGLTTSVDYEGWSYTGTSIGPNLSIGLQGDVAPGVFLRGEALVDFFGKHDLGVWGEQQLDYTGGPGTVFTARIVAGILFGQSGP